VVLALVQCGGDATASVLNVQDEEGRAPKQSAASSGNYHQILDILLVRGRRPNRQVWSDSTISDTDLLRLASTELVAHDIIDVLVFSENIVSGVHSLTLHDEYSEFLDSFYF
jgi:hypothetical protein